MTPFLYVLHDVGYVQTLLGERSAGNLHEGWDGFDDVVTEKERVDSLALVHSAVPRIRTLPLEGHSLMPEGQLASLIMAICYCLCFL